MTRLGLTASLTTTAVFAVAMLGTGGANARTPNSDPAGVSGGRLSAAPAAGAGLLGSPVAVPAGLATFGGSSAVGSAPVAATPAARGGFGGLGDRQARRRTRESFAAFVDAKGWTDLRDEPRVRVRRYVGEQAAVVDLGGSRTLVRSLLPLRAGQGERKKPLDTSLSLRDGRLRPAAALAGYSIAAGTADGSLIDFPSSGVKVTLAGADVRAARGAREGESLIYPNAYRDADALLKSLPTGAQLAVSVRGPQAPEAYPVQLTLRDSDRLVATAPGAAGPRQGPEGGAVVLRDSQVVVSVSAPAAVDATGATVAVSTEIAGNQLVYRLAHRDKTVAYPLLLDPYVAEDQRYWLGQPPAPTPPSPNPPPDFGGWAFESNPPGYVGGLQGDGGFGRGLNLFTSGNTTFPTGGVIGSWIYQAPYVPAFEAEGARIVKADFGYTGHQRSLFGGSSAMLQSIFNRQLNRPENGFVRGSDPNGAYTAYQSPIFGFIVANDEGTPGNRATYPYRVHCLSVCNAASPAGNETLGSPGNQARLGLFQSAGRPGYRGANVFMGSSLIFLTEQAAPRITTSGAPSAATWTNDPFTLAATVNDYGLGPRDANMTAPGATGLPSVVQGSPCTGAGVGAPQGGTPGSANQGDRNHRCTAPLTVQAPSSSLADGSYNVVVGATDILNNPGAASVPVKLDRQAPTIALSGTLYNARDGFVGPNQDATLQAVATDGSLSPSTAQRSGASSVTAMLDGQPMANSPVSVPCTRPEGSCTLTLNTSLTTSQLAELDAGEHTIVITAMDAL